MAAAEVAELPVITPLEGWNDTFMEELETPRHNSYDHLSSCMRGSLLHNVMDNGIAYNSTSVLEYLYHHWGSIITRMIAHGTHTRERYDTLIHRLQVQIGSIKDTLVSTREGDSISNIQTSIQTSERLSKYLMGLRFLLTKRTYTNRTLEGLRTTRSVCRTPLCTDPTGSLCELFPDLFPEGFAERGLMNSGFLRLSHKWDDRRKHLVSLYARSRIPSGWSHDLSDTSAGISQITGYSGNWQHVGIKRGRFGLLLSALDSIATQLFVSYDEYTAWTRQIGTSIRSVAGEPPVLAHPPPPLPVPVPERRPPQILADEMTLTADSPVDDVDPVTLEPFKTGDVVYKMQCCNNTILKTSIQAIIQTRGTGGLAARCPLCRSGLYGRVLR